MRAIALVLALVACKQRAEPHHGAIASQDPAGRAAPTNGGAVEIDWGRCERTVRELASVSPARRAAALLDGCRVCGEWTPLLEWSRPQAEGGPTRQAIVDAMDRCAAYCDSSAKRRFLATLDDARGTPSRAPWRYLGEMCKGAVSAFPDTRFMSAPYFALDRIARAAAAHGGDVARLLAAVELPLPAWSVTGGGLELPPANAGARDDVDVVVSALGGQLLAARLPRAHLGASGVAVDYGGEPYPGAPLAAHALATDATVLAAKDMAADALRAVVARIGGAAWLGVAADTGLPGWTIPARVPLPAAGSGATVGELAR